MSVSYRLKDERQALHIWHSTWSLNISSTNIPALAQVWLMCGLLSASSSAMSLTNFMFVHVNLTESFTFEVDWRQ